MLCKGKKKSHLGFKTLREVHEGGLSHCVG